MATNTVGKCVKNFKAFLNWSKARGYKTHADISKFKVLTEETPIVYLTQQEVDSLARHDFKDNPRLQRARDLFCLQCYTGLRWSDLTRLGNQHISGNVIRMTAFKTKKPIIVPLTAKALAILEKYDYQLPSITEQEINRSIKECCKRAGIDRLIEVPEYHGGKKTFKKVPKYEQVTSHTSVKSFITACVENGISPKVVAQITGKTVAVILGHYYGVNEEQIISEMQKAFDHG